MHHTHPAGIISRRVRVVEPCVVRRLCHGGALLVLHKPWCVCWRDCFSEKIIIRASCPYSNEQFDRHGSLFPFPSWLGRWLGLLVPLQSVEIVCEKSVGSITEGRGFVNRRAQSVERHLCVGSVVYVIQHMGVCSIPLSVSAASFYGMGYVFFCGVVSKTNPVKQSVGPFQRNINPKSAAFRPQILYVSPPC